VLGIAVALAIVTAATKMATGWWAAKRQRIGPLGRARAGAALIARGEFSIVIAGLAVASGAVDASLAALASAYVLLLAVIGPVVARFIEPIMRWLRSPRAQTSASAP
jgi:CPA2 family monovalent cation:H+ antiporter-2